MNFTNFEQLLNISSIHCQDVNLLNDSALQCQFVSSIEECSDRDGLMNYLNLVYCVLHSPTKGVIVLFCFLCVLFVGLGVTADDFLCPALLVISKTLRLSNNIAGVTFLAFGNGAPDIFSSIAGIRQANPELVIGTLYGAGIFVTTVVAGSIFIVSDFKTMGRPLCRDIIFYVMTTFIVWLTFFGGTIKIAHSVTFICIYLFYIITVVGSGIIYTKYLNKNKTEENDEPPKDVSGRVKKLVFERKYFSQTSKTQRPSITDIDDEEGVVLRRIKFRNVAVTSPQRRRTLANIRHPYHHHHENAIYSITKHELENNNENNEGSERRNTISDSSFPAHSPVITNPKPFPLMHQLSKISLSSGWSKTSLTVVMSQWREFLIHICPIDYESFKTDPWYSKVFSIFKAPIYFILTLTIPVVDEESEKHNWCKVLNILHLIISPQALIFITELSNDYNLTHELIVLGLSFILCIVVFITSEYEKPPKYHWVFAYIGFIVSVAWIYALANEVVDLLQSLGVIFNLSHLILGLTILAWGNSVGDFISNLSMARHGFPRMGISACFGGPVLNMLLGIGVPYTVLLATTPLPIHLHYSRMVTLLYATISLSLGSTLLILLFTGFQTKKWHGCYLLCIFFSFLTLACLIEWSVI